MEPADLIVLIREAFAATAHPGDGFLQGSREGEDAFAAVEPFRGIGDWEAMEPSELDRNYDALSFLSEGGFRYFLPAYLVADINGELETADAVFHLAGGFEDASVELPIGGKVYRRKIGKSAFVNPRRYGAMTFEDYARFRLSVFSREEAGAIVAYLEYRRDLPDALDAEAINAALDGFWRSRAAGAPAQPDLAAHLEAEREFMDEVGGTGV